MKKKKILVLALLASLGIQGFAKDDITGFVVDKFGKPVQGALITVTSDPVVKVSTDANGRFRLNDAKDVKTLSIAAPDNSQKTVNVTDSLLTIVMGDFDRMTNIGYEQDHTLGESTAATSTVAGDVLAKRTGRDITQTLFGYLPGLTSLQNSGLYANSSTTFYVRGQHTLSTNSPLVLVDGIERDATYITPDEVEQVTVLKDAAAVALYGYKGANGAINIVTKRGKYGTKEISFSYDHAINWNVRKPKFVNGYTYAQAHNEALGYEGSAAKYSADELAAYRSGRYPYIFPSVDWADETFRNASSTDIFSLTFRGGSQKFRYFTVANLQNNKGFIKNAFRNDGYSTQNKYSRANLRTNLDVDLTDNTKMTVNLLGTLAETSKPGAGVDLWSLIYNLPSNAFPVRLENGMWGGSSDFSGEKNPVAQAEGAAYNKQHIRSLYADLTLRQDLSSILPGLGATARIAYDNLAAYYEDRSRTYEYGYNRLDGWQDGEPQTTLWKDGVTSEMGTGKKVKTYRRVFTFYALADYNRTFGNHKLYSQLKWDYEYRNTIGLNTTYYRQNFSSYTHYGYKDRYFADLALVASAANRLSPDDRWAFSPTVSAAWVLSKENFMKNVSFIDFLKLRASFGIINTDNIPGDGYWEQNYVKDGYTAFSNTFTELENQGWRPGTIAAMGTTHEKAYKYNLGVDAQLFNGLTANIDAYYERRSDIWVDGSSKYSSALGQGVPYENAGKMESWGAELGLNYVRQTGKVTWNVGGNLSYTKNKVLEKLEAPKLYPNLVSTGMAYGQLFGLKAIGLFKDEADIASSPVQNFGSVYPGDIKYEDVNGDNKIDANDMTAIGRNTTCPEIYFSFNLGAEWKGLGFNAMFQGVGNYSAILNTAGMYQVKMGTTALSQYYYDNRWTPETPDAKFPRLSTSASQNNFQTSSWWLRDASFLKLRNVEVYYNLPKTWLQKTGFIAKAKVYVRGNDLLCLDHINESDPESYGATNPLTRSVVFGLQVGF